MLRSTGVMNGIRSNAKKADTPKSIGLAPTEVRFEDKLEEKEEGHGDFLSRGLSYHSNGIDAGGLDFWVRNGTR